MSIQNKHTAVIVGRGKISSHIPYLFSSLFSDFIFLNNRTEDLLDFQDEVKSLASNYTINSVFIAVQDRNIEAVHAEIKSFFDSKVCFFHLSGSLFFEDMIGLHPLMTFNKLTHINYKDIKIFSDNEKFYSNNKNKMPSLRYIPSDLKTLYHAMAVMMGNFPQYYLQMVKEQFPKDLNFLDFKQLTVASVENVFNDNSEELLTGPLVRKDVLTVSKHKSVLESKNLQLFKIYQQMEHLFHKELFK